MSARDDVLLKAVEFLRDPRTDAPLEKKIEFLESKGLTKQEVEEAIKRSQEPEEKSVPSTSTSTPASHPPLQNHTQQYYAPAPPPVPERDWKDYFIMATATVGVGYALYEIGKRYVLPNILPQSKSQLEADKESIDEEFVRIEATLNEMKQVQNELKEQELKKAEEVDKTIDAVHEMINTSKEKNAKVEDDFKVLKLEVENLKQSFERALEKQQSSIAGEVASIQHELQSLQALIKSKNSLTAELNGNGTKTSPVPAVSSIPSASEILKKAQMKGKSPEPQTHTPPATRSSSSTPVPTTSTTASKTTTTSIPAWQRELTGSSSSSIPAWQQAAQSSTPSPVGTPGIPAWQQAGQLHLNNTSADNINEAYKNVHWPEHEGMGSELTSNPDSESGSQ